MDILNIICEALNQTKSQYIRRRALTATLPQPIVQLALDDKSMKHLTGQFGKIGSNLNQIARKLNSGESADSKLKDDIGDCVSDRNEMLKLLRSVEEYPTLRGCKEISVGLSERTPGQLCPQLSIAERGEGQAHHLAAEPL